MTANMLFKLRWCAPTWNVALRRESWMSWANHWLAEKQCDKNQKLPVDVSSDRMSFLVCTVSRTVHQLWSLLEAVQTLCATGKLSIIWFQLQPNQSAAITVWFRYAWQSWKEWVWKIQQRVQLSQSWRIRTFNCWVCCCAVRLSDDSGLLPSNQQSSDVSGHRCSVPCSFRSYCRCRDH